MAWDRNFMRAGRVFEVMSRPFMTLELDQHGSFPSGPVLLAANHRSLLDVFVSLICCYRLGRPAKFIVGRSFFKKPGLGLFLRSIGCIEGGRGSGADVIAIDEIAKGTSCAIMPEGAIKTMEPGRILGPLLPGVAEIWSKSGCSFVGVGISGAGEVWADGRRLPHRPRSRSHRPVVRVRVTEPIPPGSEACSLDRVATIMEANCEMSEADRVAKLGLLGSR
jgi:1-acyl-sn-glycerol-3-phosphate acyltransferase